MNDETILTPLKGYNDVYKDLHHKNVIDYFDKLVKESKVDIAANKITVKKYYEILNDLDKLKKDLSEKKMLRVLFNVFLFVVIFVSIIFFIKAFVTNSVHVAVGVIMIFVIIGSIVGYVFFNKKMNEIIQKLESEINDKDSIANKLKDEGYKQMNSLNSSFEYGISSSLVNKTVPLITMDKVLDNKKLEELKSYGFTENNYKNSSTYFVQSGAILGNPFALVTNHIQYWRDKIYTGSLTIHWTTVEKTKDGYKTVEHTQVLTAAISKPVPNYCYVTKLYFGSDAAPDLCFSRKPTAGSKMSEKERDRYIERESRKLDKKAEKSTNNNQGYTKIANDEFEVLFNADNRNNEVQFRLMYTPLAQQNIVSLLLNSPYGDDFDQEKDKKMNIIYTSHSQMFDYSDRPDRYIHFDYEKIKSNFIEYNDSYFKSFYFEIAPLLSVPLYQQTKAHNYIYPDSYKSNVTSFEQECMANRIGQSYFSPNGSCTSSILKVRQVGKVSNFDNVSVTAYSFQAINRVALIPKMGGDGYMHSVPVPWVEYLPIEECKSMNVSEKNMSKAKYNSLKTSDSFNNLMGKISKYYAYKNGLFATVGKYFSNDDATYANGIITDDEIKKKTVLQTGAIMMASALINAIDEKKNEDGDDKNNNE